ncbi:Heat shock protein DnaJ, cysteine-rich domain containing protein [Parasponia andersonii]|uniref:Heat shock protein DnaJ, cysteine-rich domain containing protein n=1 Tax=Parasponia andersonii TaxID=3476 RepID=A0A2P5AAM6_PARAD|nr:Heat shock protein DnaJ, cysteine-rich domain containing protein [Parasponia andersonii]
MASMSSLQTIFPAKSGNPSLSGVCNPSTTPAGSTVLSWNKSQKYKKRRPLTVVAAAGDVSADGTAYLIAGAAAVALLGTAFPILFSRKDLCPECDGAGFVRKSGVTLRANAARKDEAQIVCARCNGLGKLNQVDKY